MKNHDLEIGRKEFYNLQRGEALKKLSKQDEMKLLLSILNEEDFVSSFIHETEATFNTNKLKMPLSVLVEILNTGKTFPFALCFITSESTATFEFMEDQMHEIFFTTVSGPD